MASNAGWFAITFSTGKFNSAFLVQHGTLQEFQAKYPGATIAGPFATKAQAEAESSKQRTTTGQPSGAAIPAIPNPLAFLGFLGGIGHWIGDLVLHLTDVHMWISIGWLILGATLLILGILYWLRIPQKVFSVAGSAAAAAVPK